MGPGRYPQYTRADFGPEAVGISNHKHDTSPNVKPFGRVKSRKIPKSECPDIWIRLPRHKWPKSLSSIEDPVVPLERNLYGHPLAGLIWERQFEKNPIAARLGGGFQLGMPIRTPSKRIILICECG